MTHCLAMQDHHTRKKGQPKYFSLLVSQAVVRETGVIIKAGRAVHLPPDV